jgi:uncharacterized protein YjbJ (UPF0337 family)
MNWDQIEGQWQQLNEAVRERWGKLTHDDIQTFAGKRGHLVGRIQERYCVSKAEAEKQAEDWSRGLKEPGGKPISRGGIW